MVVVKIFAEYLKCAAYFISQWKVGFKFDFIFLNKKNNLNTSKSLLNMLGLVVTVFVLYFSGHIEKRNSRRA